MQRERGYGAPSISWACRGHLVNRENRMSDSWAVEGGLWPEKSELSSSRSELEMSKKTDESALESP